jgi:putative nucleotidyltransferase with HDIG domain
MDLNNIEKALYEYAKSFDLNNEMILLKYNHTLRVANNAKNLALSLGLTDEDVYLATIIGYLHDIARFSQWDRFKTFNDNKSFDHGNVGAEILFKDNLIENFNIDKKYYKAIEFAIVNHNKFEINEKDITNNGKLDKNLLLQAKIIRDADKLDIFSDITKGQLPVTTATFTQTGLTNEVYMFFKNKQSVNHKYVKTTIDRAVAQLAMTYDLNFDYSKNFVKNLNYSQNLYNIYKKSLNNSDVKTLTDIFRDYNNNFANTNLNDQSITNYLN